MLQVVYLSGHFHYYPLLRSPLEEIINLKFEDHLGSQVMVWSENGVLTASYGGPPAAMRRMMAVLSR